MDREELIRRHARDPRATSVWRVLSPGAWDALKPLGNWSLSHKGITIGLAALVGLGLACCALATAMWACPDDATGRDMICSDSSRGPLWTVATGLAAGPSLLVTWYWRSRNADQSPAFALIERYVQAAEMLRSEEPTSRIAALYLLARISWSSEHWRQDAVGLLLAFVNSRQDDAPDTRLAMVLLRRGDLQPHSSARPAVRSGPTPGTKRPTKGAAVPRRRGQ